VSALPVEEGGYAFILALKWVGIDSFWLTIIGLVVIFLQAITINSISLKNQFFQDRITFPAFFYIVFQSMTLVFMPPSAIVFGLVFFSFALYYFFTIHQQADASSSQFNIGFFIGLAWLFYQPFLWMLLYFTFRLLVIKQVKIADIIQVFTGWLAALFLSIVFAFLTDTLELYYVLQGKQTFVVVRTIESFSHWSLWIVVGLWMIAVMLSVAQYSKMTYKVSLPNKKKIGLLFELLLALSVCLLLQKRLNIQDILILSPPLCILLAGATYYIKNQLIKELIPLVFIGSLLFLQFYFAV
jgi:hypothetical protein